ncbi:hypothetical protein GUJ93_ZPchr0004g38984 [Zizania palustris]|nr:hypothetical protein GUJ93_ZPchr0004g38984 [Zizania palustris]
MGSTYAFWKTLNKEERQAKQCYLQMFYNLQFRNLAKAVPRAAGEQLQASVAPSEMVVKPKERKPQTRIQRILTRLVVPQNLPILE